VSTTVPQEWVSRKGVAEFLNLRSLNTVDKLRDRGMPAIKLGDTKGSTVRFWLPDVDAWVREHGIDDEAA
jgi:phage terminase Nu1 subunit (DNA packaging protein)